MQVSEFKAWFEGFTEAMTGPPTEEQWARIRAEVDEIDGTETVVQPIHIPLPEQSFPYFFPGPNQSTTGGTDATHGAARLKT